MKDYASSICYILFDLGARIRSLLAQHHSRETPFADIEHSDPQTHGYEGRP